MSTGLIWLGVASAGVSSVHLMKLMVLIKAVNVLSSVLMTGRRDLDW